MGVNANNYLGADLVWTPFTNDKELPVGVPLAFREDDGTFMFGYVQKISNSTMLVVDGAFGFDRMDQLKTSEWTSLEFVFKTDEEMDDGLG